MNSIKPKLALACAGLLCLHTLPAYAEAVNEGAIPPPKIEAGSHAPISILDFTGVSWPKENRPGSDIPIRFTIVNNGRGAAKNIHIRAESQDLGALVPKSVSNVNAKYFKPGQSEIYNFLFRLTDTAKKKNYPLKLTVAYVDEATDEVHQSTQMVTVPSTGAADLASLGDKEGDLSGLGDVSSGGMGAGSLGGDFGGVSSSDLGPALPVTGTGSAPQGQAPTGANSPKIVIDSYSMDPEQVKAGEPFTLYFRVFNTNRNKSVKNIRVALSADAADAVSLPSSSSGDASPAAAMAQADPSGGGSAFIPVGSSNTFHIEKIKPRKAAEKEITLTTAPDTAPRTYSITATFEYEDGDGNPYTSSEVIGIPVIQNSVLEPGDLNVEKTGYVGEEMPLSFEFFNTGKSVLSNVMVKLRGNFDTDTNTYFAGNVAPSSAETYDVNITPLEKGEQRGEIVISYDDATGKKQEFVKPFSITVKEGVADGEETSEDENARPAWAIPLGLGVMALVAGGIAFYVVKKRKEGGGDDEDLTV